VLLQYYFSDANVFHTVGWATGRASGV